MKNYKIILSYDGTKYKGWQGQKSTDATIQGKVEGVLSKLAGRPVEVIGSGRTDAGAHAIGQAANFHMEEQFTAEDILNNLNRYLPEDIAALSIKEVPARFHSRLWAVSKTYRYRIHTSQIGEVFERKYVYTYQEPLDIKAMEQASAYLVGTYDFTSFCGNRHMKKTADRTIFSIKFIEKEGELAIDYCGDGFLQNMVRIITGTLIEVGQGKRRPEDMVNLLKAKKREATGYTAPAHGLSLLSVEYDENRRE